MLNSEKILQEIVRIRKKLFDESLTHLSSGRARRNLGAQLALTVRNELEWVELGTPFSNLEPLSTRTVPACCGLTSWYLPKVDGGGSGMVEGVVKLEANSRSGRDRDGL